MPEIGETLRETRMRRRIDITEVETATKIRAKYLRALENEEWNLLPGPTFVKTFLRTYAEYLEIDPRLIVEEYKQRFEGPGTQELTPLKPNLNARRRPPRAGPGPGLVVGIVVVVLVALLFLIGKLWPTDDDGGGGREPNSVAGAPTATTTAEPAKERRSSKRRRKERRAAPVRLRIVPTGQVSVCLVGAGGKVLIDNASLSDVAPTRVFRSRRFRVSFGNGNAVMRVGERRIDVPDRSTPVGYEIRAGRARETQRRPTCS